jgi:hypothetical protein
VEWNRAGHRFIFSVRSTNWTEVKKRQSDLQEYQQQEREALKNAIQGMGEGLKVMQQKVLELMTARHQKQMVWRREREREMERESGTGEDRGKKEREVVQERGQRGQGRRRGEEENSERRTEERTEGQRRGERETTLTQR